MVDVGMYNFVKNAIAAGKSKEDITADLSRGGRLSRAMIEEAFVAVTSGQAPATPAAGPEVAATPKQTGDVSFQEKIVSAADVGLTLPASTVGRASPSAMMKSGTSVGLSAAGNTSGQGSASIVPEEVRRWSWGAFGFTWLWGMFNNTWIALLALIPLVGFVMIFVLGFKGSEWAWRNKRWESVEQFRRVQRRWGIAYLILILIAVVLLAVAVVLASLAQARLRASQQQADQAQTAQQQASDAFHPSSGQ